MYLYVYYLNVTVRFSVSVDQTRNLEIKESEGGKFVKQQNSFTKFCLLLLVYIYI